MELRMSSDCLDIASHTPKTLSLGYFSHSLSVAAMLSVMHDWAKSLT